jgi:predicted nucleic acid-binding protein
MIVLDTNVLSETLRESVNAGVVQWFENMAAESLFTTSITQAELWLGARLLPSGKRREQLEAAIDGIFADLAGRILAFDEAAATDYADIMVARRNAGRPISQFDCQIAAITKSRGARLATRNERDFHGCGIELVNPFS